MKIADSYKFSHKFSFIPFLPFRKIQKKIKLPASWWSGNEKYFCFVFILGLALLQSHAEFNRLDFFLHVIPVHVIIPCSKPKKNL